MKVLAAIVAVVYLVVAYLSQGGEAAFKLGMFLVLPLSCIWFSGAIGEYTGPGFSRSTISTASPGWMVAIGGWVLLLLPVVVGLIVHFS